MTHEATTPSATLTDLIELFKAREAAGLVKYGTTVDRDDLSLADWLQHALEESMDKPIYLMRALKKLRASQPAEQPRGEVPACERCGECQCGNFAACKNRQYFTAQPKPEQAVSDGVVESGPAKGLNAEGWARAMGIMGTTSDDHPTGPYERVLAAAIRGYLGSADPYGPGSVPAATFDRTIETPRRRQAVEKMLELGWTYHHERGWIGRGIEEPQRPAVATPAEVTDEASVLRAELQHMVRAYVRLLEVGRDRIVDLGGSCDPLDVMEQADPHLIQAKRALALTAQCQVRKDTQGLGDSGRLTPDLFNRFTLAMRTLVRERKVYGEDLETIHEVVCVLEAAIASPSAGAVVPEGWKLVPIEPTEAMIEAYHSVEHVTAKSDEDADDAWAIADYKAMIAAAPEVKS